MATNNSNQQNVNVGLNLNGNAVASVQQLVQHMTALKKVAVDVGSALQQIDKAMKQQGSGARPTLQSLKQMNQNINMLGTTPDTLLAQFYKNQGRIVQSQNLNSLVGTRRQLTNPNTLNKLFDEHGTKLVGQAIQIRLDAAQLKNDTKAIQKAQLEMATYKAEMQKYNTSLKGLHQLKVQQDQLVSQMLSTPIGAAALRGTAQGKLESQFSSGAKEKAIQKYMASPNRIQPRTNDFSNANPNQLRNYAQENASKIEATKRIMGQLYLEGSAQSKQQLQNYGQILSALEQEKTKLQAVNNLRRASLRNQDEQIKKLREEQNITKLQGKYGDLNTSLNQTYKPLSAEKIATLSADNLARRELTMKTRLTQANEAYRLSERLGNKASIKEAQDRVVAMQKELDMIKARNRELTQAGRPNSMVSRYQEMSTGESGGALLGMQGILMRNYMLWGAFMGSIAGSYAFLRDFEVALKQTQAISQATNTQMESLKNNILEVAENSRFTAIEITEAATTLAQAGFSISEIDKTLESVTLLATATGSTLKETVDIATASLGAFQLSATNMPKIVNQITQAMNLSKLDIQKFQLAVQYAGNAASDAGLNFEELLASVSTVANAGVRSGSTLGTGFRQLLSDLISPSTKFEKILHRLGLTSADVDVRTNGLVGTLKQLKDAGFSTADAYESFEVRSVAFYTALANNLGTYDDLLANLDSNTAAMEANEVQMASMGAQSDRMFNQLKAVAEVAGGELRSALTDLFHIIGDVLVVVKDLLDNGIARTTVQMGVMTVAIGAALLVIKSSGMALAGLTRTLLSVAGGATAASVAINLLKSSTGVFFAIGAAVSVAYVAINKMTGDLGALKEATERSKTAVNNLADETNKLQTTIVETDKKIVSLESRFESLKDDPAAVAVEMNNLRSKALELGITLSVDFTNSINGVINGWRELRLELGKEIEMNLTRQMEELNLLSTAMANLRQQEAKDAPRPNSPQLAKKYGLDFIASYTNLSQQAVSASSVANQFHGKDAYLNVLSKNNQTDLKVILNEIAKNPKATMSADKMLSIIQEYDYFLANIDSFDPEKIPTIVDNLNKELYKVIELTRQTQNQYRSFISNTKYAPIVNENSRKSVATLDNVLKYFGDLQGNANSITNPIRQSQNIKNQRNVQKAYNDYALLDTSASFKAPTKVDNFAFDADRRRSMEIIYNQIAQSDLTPRAKQALFSHVGREGGFKKENLSGYHKDKNNNVSNVGIISYNFKTRRDAFIKAMTQNGYMDAKGNIVHSPSAIEFQAQFMLDELKKNYPKQYKVLTNSKSTPAEIEQAMWEFIGWQRDLKSATRDRDFYAKVYSQGVTGKAPSAIVDGGKYNVVNNLDLPENAEALLYRKSKFEEQKSIITQQLQALGDPKSYSEDAKVKAKSLTNNLTAIDQHISQMTSESMNIVRNVQLQKQEEIKAQENAVKLTEQRQQQELQTLEAQVKEMDAKIETGKFSNSDLNLRKEYANKVGELKKQLARTKAEGAKVGAYEYKDQSIIINKDLQAIIDEGLSFELKKIDNETALEHKEYIKKAAKSYAEALNKAYDIFTTNIDNQIKNLQEAYTQAEEILAFDEKVFRNKMAESSGLNKTKAERQLMDDPKYAKGYTDTQRGALDKKISELETEVDKSTLIFDESRLKLLTEKELKLSKIVNDSIADLAKKEKELGEGLTNLNIDPTLKTEMITEFEKAKLKNAKDMREYSEQIKNIQLEKIELQNKMDGKDVSNLPTKMGVGSIFKEQARQIYDATQTAQAMEGNITNIIGSINGAFNELIDNAIAASDNVDDFFKIITGGSSESREAFKAFGYSIVQTMARIVQDTMVKKFVKMMTDWMFPENGAASGEGADGGGMGILGSAVGAIAGAFGKGIVGGASFGSTASTGTAPLWSSGSDSFRFMSQGGLVNGSTKNVDNVPVMAADGEYVLPSSVTETVGLGFLERLRKDPNSVVNDKIKITPNQGGKAQIPSFTNVYVVSPDKVPSSTSKSDIIVAVEDNVARGGSLKKLIKQVANGG